MIITSQLLAAFVMFAFVSSITPGPNNMMVLASGLNYGFQRTLPHILGITLGFGLMIFLVGIGITSIFEHYPQLFTVLQVICGIYLIYLAWKIARAAPIACETSDKKPMTFLQAAAFQWVNPKAWVMGVAAIATYVPKQNFLINVMLIAILFTMITGPCVGLWAACGNWLRRFLTHPVLYRVFNVSMAILLVLSLYPLAKEMG